MTRKSIPRALAREAKIYALIVAELVSGVFAGLLLVGLVPGDGVNFDVIGSMIMLIPAVTVFLVAGKIRKNES